MLPEFSIHVSQIHLKLSSNRIESLISKHWQIGRALKSISNLMQHSTTAAIDTFMFKKSRKNYVWWTLIWDSNIFPCPSIVRGISLTRKEKVSVRGETILMIYVAIRKVICSPDLAASLFYTLDNPKYFKTRWKLPKQLIIYCQLGFLESLEWVLLQTSEVSTLWTKVTNRSALKWKIFSSGFPKCFHSCHAQAILRPGGLISCTRVRRCQQGWTCLVQ